MSAAPAVMGSYPEVAGADARAHARQHTEVQVGGEGELNAGDLEGEGVAENNLSDAACSRRTSPEMLPGERKVFEGDMAFLRWLGFPTIPSFIAIP